MAHVILAALRKPDFCICQNKDADLSAFVFATRIVQSLYFLSPKFQASNHILWLCSPVCVGPGRKPRRLVSSQRGSYVSFIQADEPEEKTEPEKSEMEAESAPEPQVCATVKTTFHHWFDNVGNLEVSDSQNNHIITLKFKQIMKHWAR